MSTTESLFDIVVSTFGIIIFIGCFIILFIYNGKISSMLSLVKIGPNFPLEVKGIDILIAWKQYKGSHYLPVENEFATPYHLAPYIEINGLLPCFVTNGKVGLYRVKNKYYDYGRELLDLVLERAITLKELQTEYELRGLFDSKVNLKADEYTESF